MASHEPEKISSVIIWLVQTCRNKVESAESRIKTSANLQSGGKLCDQLNLYVFLWSWLQNEKQTIGFKQSSVFIA